LTEDLPGDDKFEDSMWRSEVERGFIPMKSKIVSYLAPLALAFLQTASAAQNSLYFLESQVPTEVQAAHESFLMGEFDKMAVQIKRALMAYPYDAGIQRDLLDLYDKAYELKGFSAISPDWQAPKGVHWIGVSAKKIYQSQRGTIDYRIGLSFDHDKELDVEQARVVKYPNEVILDKERGVGDWDESPEGDRMLSFWIGSEYLKRSISEGLYLLEIKLKGQETVHGWFLFSRVNATESPEVSVPTKRQVFSTGNPTFQWKNFVSSEYRSYEKRKITLVVFRNANGVKDNTWSFSHEANLTSATVGTSGEGEIGAKTLRPDEYVLHLNYRERRQFGDLTVSRESVTQTPFSVKY
jgi:hypothetical protein